MRRVVLSWSSGKDGAWALHVLRQQPHVEVVGLLTTYDESADRVAMHGVRRSLVEAQARAAGLPLRLVPLPPACPNREYEHRLRAEIARMRAEGATHIAFGDLYLEDIRAYRVHLLDGSGLEPIFPVWCSPEQTGALAREIVRSGVRAVVTSVDIAQLPQEFAGREYDAAFLAALPDGVDPCGERGEFHTFCYAGPMFGPGLPVEVGEVISDGPQCVVDLRAL